MRTANNPIKLVQSQCPVMLVTGLAIFRPAIEPRTHGTTLHPIAVQPAPREPTPHYLQTAVPPAPRRVTPNSFPPAVNSPPLTAGMLNPAR